MENANQAPIQIIGRVEVHILSNGTARAVNLPRDASGLIEVIRLLTVLWQQEQQTKASPLVLPVHQIRNGG